VANLIIFISKNGEKNHKKSQNFRGFFHFLKNKKFQVDKKFPLPKNKTHFECKNELDFVGFVSF
jgi:hypothetical protein